MTERAQQALADIGMTPRRASILATGQPDTLRFVFTRGVMPSFEKIQRLAAVLGLSPGYLAGQTHERELDSRALRFLNGIRYEIGLPPLGMDKKDVTDSTANSARLESARQSIIDILEKIPENEIWVFSPQPELSERMFMDEYGKIFTDQDLSVAFNGSPSVIARPAPLRSPGPIYGLLLKRDAIGTFWHPSDPILFDALKSPKPGDFVAIYVRGRLGDEATDFSFGRLNKIEHDHVEVDRLNGKPRVMIARSIIVAMHTAIHWHEVIGAN